MTRHPGERSQPDSSESDVESGRSTQQRELRRYASDARNNRRRMSVEAVADMHNTFPGILSWEVWQSCFTMSWLRVDVSRPVERKAFVKQESELALIWALLLTVACTGLFSLGDIVNNSLSGDDLVLKVIAHSCGFFFCSATIAFVFATFGSVFLLLAAEKTTLDYEFSHLHALLGQNIPRLPIYFGAYGSVSAFLGLIAYFALLFSSHYTYCCLGVCMMSFPVAGYSMLRLTQAVEIVDKTTHMACDQIWARADPEEIYGELKRYFVEEKSMRFEDVRRGEFMERFGDNADSTTHKLASRIYDDWVEKKITSMLKVDPGF